MINGSTLANGGCWEWHLHRDRKGYGRAVDAATGEVLAHRISWIAHHGPIPKGMHVLHRCDNPPCVNPEHLFLGTNDDNAADRHAKGRSKGAAGERNGKAKLLPEHVAQIRREVALLPLSPSGKRLKDGALAPVAAKYGISESSIRALVAGKTWSHIR
ncbi:MAG TPA: HNH endonuclease signature motif containing protein [Ramlibacter sp.]|nr:HNH endonuclease signature motif containing protein [Ramlibacter sp.]